MRRHIWHRTGHIGNHILLGETSCEFSTEECPCIACHTPYIHGFSRLNVLSCDVSIHIWCHSVCCILCKWPLTHLSQVAGLVYLVYKARHPPQGDPVSSAGICCPSFWSFYHNEHTGMSWALWYVQTVRVSFSQVFPIHHSLVLQKYQDLKRGFYICKNFWFSPSSWSSFSSFTPDSSTKSSSSAPGSES